MKPFSITALLFAAPAGLAGLAPEACLYDRAAILQGAWWRLWTGHWVHFSASHLAWNLIVLIGAGAWLERLRPGLLARYALAGAPLLSLGLLVLAPDMAVYGGLSGLATGVVVLLALANLQARPAERGWWIALLALTAGKIATDAFSGTPLFTEFGPDTVRVSALAHALGAALALPACLIRPFPARSKRAPRHENRPQLPAAARRPGDHSSWKIPAGCRRWLVIRSPGEGGCRHAGLRPDRSRCLLRAHRLHRFARTDAGHAARDHAAPRNLDPV